MNDLVLAAKAPDWYKLKALVLDSVSSPITRRVYNMALDEFMVWFQLELRPGFSKATVSAWRASLEPRKINYRWFRSTSELPSVKQPSSNRVKFLAVGLFHMPFPFLEWILRIK